MPARPATADAPLIARLREAGAVLIGKTNLHEFALGTTSDESAWGPARHPADPARAAGGSSGGSAAAVATGMGLGSIGTDTGGSIRIPAAACGVVGLKPTFGEVPLDGVVPLSTSLDHAGPIARTVEDAGLLWEALTGGKVGAPPVAAGLRLGLLSGYFGDPLAPDVRHALDAALEALRGAGVVIVPLSLDGAEEIAAAYIDVVLPEAAAWHTSHVGAPESAYTPGVWTRLARGRDVPAVRYLAALETCRRLARAVDGLLGGVDALVTPTLPILAPPVGAADIDIDPAAPGPVPIRAAMLKHTQPFNMSGHPAISLPVPAQGLPVGLQLIGARRATGRLLGLAAACERALQMR
jgi:aspartyl-tRNA(Asn)/glutamyl-tRNA(Gln) amidotransferase subunit A